MFRLGLCLPVYNGVETIERLLESVGQILSDEIILIVSDNASRDGTNEILVKFSSENQNCHIQHLEKTVIFEENFLNCARIAAENKCDFVCFVGDDDECLPEYKRLAVWLREEVLNREIDYVFLNAQRLAPNNVVLGPILSDCETLLNVNKDQLSKILGLNVAFTTTLCFRTRYILEANTDNIGSGWWFLELAYSTLEDATAIYSTKCSNFYEGSKANLNGKFFHMIKSLLVTIDRVEISNLVVSNNLKSQVLTPDIIKTVYTQKINGYRLAFKELRLASTFYTYSKLYALIYLFSILIPRFFYVIAHKVKKSCQ